MADADRTLRRFAGYSMKRAFNAVQTDVNTALKPFGLRMVTFSALVIIVDNPGLKQSDLAEILSIERPNLVLIVDELEVQELITRERTPEDRRAYSLQATLTGRRVYERALEAVERHDDKMMAGLSTEQRLAIVAALRRVEQNGRNDHDAGQIPAS